MSNESRDSSAGKLPLFPPLHISGIYIVTNGMSEKTDITEKHKIREYLKENRRKREFVSFRQAKKGREHEFPTSSPAM